MPETSTATVGISHPTDDHESARLTSLFEAHRGFEITPRLRSHLWLGVLDCLVIGGGYGLVELTYRGSRGSPAYGQIFPLFLIVAWFVHVLAHHAFGLYRRIWKYAGANEARDVLLASVTAVALLTAVHGVRQFAPVRAVPVGVILVGGLLATLGVGAVRFHARLAGFSHRADRSRLRVAVIGSRDAGASTIRDMLNNPGAGLVPVAVFDNDCLDHGLSLLGVPVVGPVAAIPEAKAKYGFEQVLLTIPSPSSALIHESLLAAEGAGVTMRLLPGMREMAGGIPARPIHRPRPFRIEDLLGRQQIVTDLNAVRDSLSPHRILITGAGGSIGSEISQQVAQFDPELVILLDRDETHLHDVASLLTGNFVQELVDIRDPDAVFDVFDRHRPSVVFHAAAHKHVPILETHPIEAARTNVFGTLNLVEAAVGYDVPRFVMISTDKAVRPTSVMGAAKLIGERILLAQPPGTTTFSAVRFGNVLGSRGSVIPTFSRQIAAGGPVTVTDPLMTRFFMSIEEAVQLVLQASLLASGRDIFMLEMGEPVSILDLARRMIRLSGYGVGTEIAIEFVGGRPGERLSEELCAPDEERVPTGHPSILRLTSPAIHEDVLAKGLLQLQEAVGLYDATRVRAALFSLASPVPQLVGQVGSAVSA